MSQDSELTVDPTPRDASRLPFANETGLQTFVEKHAKAILDLEVIASTRTGAGRLFHIDILAIDKTNRPFIIECKWDLVDTRALGQLAKYKDALLSGWDRFEKRVREVRGNSVRVKKTEPVLITIGYRYDRAPLADDQAAVCLAYTYHDVVFTDERLQERGPGQVSLQFAAKAILPPARHPKVSKKSATHRRLEALAAGLREAFWALDAKLVSLDGVVPTYGGKNFVRYRKRNRLFAEAVIGPELIQWRFRCPKPPRGSDRIDRRESSGTLNCAADMRAASGAKKLFAFLHDAYREAG
jgi:hypothetical protein